MSYTLESINKKMQTLSNVPIIVLEWNGVKNPVKYKCNLCNTEYVLATGEALYRTNKKCWCKNCSKCGGMTLKEFEKKVNKDVNNPVKIISFTKVKEPCTFQCLECQNISTVSKGEVLLKRPKMYHCGNCHNTKERITRNNYDELLILCEKHNIEIIQWTNSSLPFIYKCKICGYIGTSTFGRFKEHAECISCKGLRPNLNIFLQKLKNIHNDEYTIVDESQWKNMHTKMLFRHKCGFIWSSSPGDLLVHNCPKCTKSRSNGEIVAQQFLEDNHINFISQYAIKINGHTLRFDFYLPEKDIYIEINGEQHYLPIEYFGGVDKYKQRIKLDQLKRDYAGSKLIEIPYLNKDMQSIIKFLQGSTTILNKEQE